MEAFLLPGPVTMDPRVQEAMAAPAVAHRGDAFTAINRRLFARLRELMGTPRVAVLAGSGTAGMEAAVSNLVHWGDRAVSFTNGKFGDRMAELVERYAGSAASRVTTDWGRPIDLDAVEAALEEGASAVAFTLNETSTGVLNDGAAIARLCRKHGALSIADTITATGGLPVPAELDVTVVGSQKCVGGPPGLAFVGLSERAAAALDSPTLYLDLRRYVEKAEEGQTPFTPAVPLHLACLTALDLLFDEGLEARFTRVAAQAKACRDAAARAGLALAAPASPSPTVTAIRYPAGIEDAAFRAALRGRGVTVAGAQGAWKGNVFRIGHMGTVTWTMLQEGWAAIEEELNAAGHDTPRNCFAATT